MRGLNRARRYGVNPVGAGCVDRLAIHKDLVLSRTVGTDTQRRLLHSTGINGDSAPDPHYVRVAGLAVLGVGLPATRVNICRGPRRIVSQPVDALVERHPNDLRAESAGHDHQEGNQPVSHQGTPLRDSASAGNGHHRMIVGKGRARPRVYRCRPACLWLRCGSKRFRRHASDPPQNRSRRPLFFRIRKENLARALGLRPVVPALEESEMALADGGRGRPGRRGEHSENLFKPALENAACELRSDWCVRLARFGLCFCCAVPNLRFRVL